MSKVEFILEKEWELFTILNNADYRESCQDNKSEFMINRGSQWENLNDDILESYIDDLIEAEKNNENLIFQKYAYMMEYTHIDEFQKLKSTLPLIEEEKLKVISEIEKIMVSWGKEMEIKYPKFCRTARLVEKLDENKKASSQIYLIGEHKTYSLKTNKLYLEYIKSINYNLVEKIYESIISKKGYGGSLKKLEKML